jgi:hypothetical protein
MCVSHTQIHYINIRHEFVHQGFGMYAFVREHSRALTKTVACEKVLKLRIKFVTLTIKSSGFEETVLCVA